MNHYLLGSAIMPSVLLVWFFHRRDLYPEPARVLWTTFFLGVLTVIPVLLVVSPFSKYMELVENPFLSGAVTAFAGAAIPEEFFKFLVVVFYCARHKEFDEAMDGIVYGVVASLGFATLENILYVSDGGYNVAILRALTAVPGHALTGAFMGYFIGQAKFGEGSSKRNWILALLAPILLHGMYDFPLMAVSNYANAGGTSNSVIGLLGIVVVVMIYEWVFVVRRMHRLHRDQDKLAALSATTTGKNKTTEEKTTPAPGSTAQPADDKSADSSEQTDNKTANTLLGLLYLALCTLLASGGALMGLGLAVNLSGDDDIQLVSTILVALLFCLLPVAIGVWLFRKGLRRLNR